MTTQNSDIAINGPEILAKVANFLSQYLACTQSQLAVLTLWTLHTHCFTASPITPYLHLRSREREAGKTVCMELLNLLCSNSWLTSGCTPSVLLTKLIQSERSTLLLDDCDPVLARTRNPVTLGLLNRGFTREQTYSIPGTADGETRIRAIDAFCPKAFAGMLALPSSIDQLCIPIDLEPKELGARVKRFSIKAVRTQSLPLQESLRQWAAENATRLAAVAPYNETQLPQELSPRQQDCAEPLLRLADLIGGNWPGWARQALVNIYSVDDPEEEDFVKESQAAPGPHVIRGYRRNF
ncbi:MAG TPA: DUF3631 domain-containing protein [Candidatus Angelobacter sp.]|jgi:hypothetical protein|nr:DUF3631 domain-containing protein [Candidatus Angelobacter sp.]